jgi:hypothetical protein
MFDSVISVTYNLYLRIVPLSTVTVSEAHLMTEDILDNMHTNVFSKSIPKSITTIACGVHVLYRANVSFKADNISAINGESDLLSIDARFKLMVGQHDPYEFANILNSIDMYNFSSGPGSKEILFKIIVQDDSLNFAYDIVSMLSELSFGQSFTPLHFLIRHAARGIDGFAIIPYIKYC